MGALQGALGACFMFGYILGSTLFTYLSVSLGAERDYLMFVIGAAISAVGTLSVAYLNATFDVVAS